MSAKNISYVMETENMLKGVALDVYRIISESPNITVGEIYKQYRARRPKFGRSRNEIAKRVRDLEVWGAVSKAGKSVCDLTGKTVYTFCITGDVPVKKKQKKAESKDMEKSLESLDFLLSYWNEFHEKNLSNISKEKKKQVESFFATKAKKSASLDQIATIKAIFNFVEEYKARFGAKK